MDFTNMVLCITDHEFTASHTRSWFEIHLSIFLFYLIDKYRANFNFINIKEPLHQTNFVPGWYQNYLY